MIFWLSLAALAQAPGDGLPAFDADPLRIVVDSQHALSVEHTDLTPGVVAGLHGRWGDSLLVVRRSGESTTLLESVAGLQASAAWSGEHLRVGASVPMVLHASGAQAPEGVTALGDITLDAKVGGWNPGSGIVRLAGALRLGLPTGGGASLVGSDSPWIEPVVVVGAHGGRVQAHVNLGAGVQGATEVGRSTVGSSLVYRGSLSAELTPQWSVTGEAWGRSRFAGTNTHPLEGLASVRWHGSTISAYAGGGGGVLPGIGAPRWRLVAGVTAGAPQAVSP